MQAFAFIVLLATSVNGQLPNPWDDLKPDDGWPVTDCVPLENMVAIGELSSECCWSAQASIAFGAINGGLGDMIPGCLAGPTDAFCENDGTKMPLQDVLDYAGLYLCCMSGHPDTPDVPCGQQVLINAIEVGAVMNSAVIGGFDSNGDGLVDGCKALYDDGDLEKACAQIMGGPLKYNPDDVFSITDAPTDPPTDPPTGAPAVAATQEPSAPPTTKPPTEGDGAISGASGVSASVALVTTFTLGLLGLQCA